MIFGKQIITTFLVAATWTSSHVAGEGKVQFNYDPTSDIGPEHWKDLQYQGGNECGGMSNSPIAVESAPCDFYDDYIFTPGTCVFGDHDFIINDLEVQVNVTRTQGCERSTFQVPGVDKVFELLQFHIHLSSEHTFDGKKFGAELHMVHREQGGERLAVVGLFVTPTSTDSNKMFDALLSEFNAVSDEQHMECNMTTLPHFWQPHDEDISQEQLNVYDLIPEGSSFYNYDGGLTTPPCLQIVEWSIVDQPIEITVSQYNDLSSMILNYLDAESCELATIADPYSGSTSRPSQPLNGRAVTRICPVDFQV